MKEIRPLYATNGSILHQYKIFRAFIPKPLMLKHQNWTFFPTHKMEVSKLITFLI